MLRVVIQHARPGMKLAMPVLHPRTGTVLLKAGFQLSDRFIRKLRELSVTECWVEYPSTEEIRRFISPRIQQRKGQVSEMIAGMFETLHQDAHAKLEFAEYRRVLRSLIEELVMDPTASSYFTEMGGTSDNELRHASEVCFLSILLGLKMHQYLIQERTRLGANQARDVLSLGIGAIVHDIGKMQLDDETRARCHVTADESDPDWRAHPTIGHRMLSGSVRPAAAGVVLQHHQYFDGSGFPREVENADGSHACLVVRRFEQRLDFRQRHVLVCGCSVERVLHPDADDLCIRATAKVPADLGALGLRFVFAKCGDDIERHTGATGVGSVSGNRYDGDLNVHNTSAV
jgi:hypothetical protein